MCGGVEGGERSGCPLYRLHGELAATVVRDSAAAVQQELLACYVLIERMGRGVVCVPAPHTLSHDLLHAEGIFKVGRVDSNSSLLPNSHSLQAVGPWQRWESCRMC